MLAISFLSTSCSDEDEPETEESKLCGTWIENDSDLPYILVLNSDSSGSISFSDEGITFTQNFSWSIGVTSDGLSYLNVIVTSGVDIFENGRYSYTLIGNSLSLGSDLTFTRQ